MMRESTKNSGLFVRFGLLVVLVGFAAIGDRVLAGDDQSDPVFRAGAATANITPSLGADIVGGFRPIPAKHIHDELLVRCLVLDDGATRLVIVMCDNVGIPREVFDAAKASVHGVTGLPIEHMLMASTHTHSAASARGPSKVAYETELTSYQWFIISRITDVVQCAINNLEPARIGWGSASEPDQVFNRRWFSTDPDVRRNPFGGIDEVRMNPPRAHESLVKPAGPVDPEISFLTVQSTDGRPIALLANYSLHYVGGVRSGDISADYFGMFAERIEELLGAEDVEPPFVGMLSNGTSADVNNINFREKSPRMQPYEKMQIVADAVAAHVYEAHQSVQFEDQITLAAGYRELTLKTRIPSPELLEWARTTLDKPEDTDQWHRVETNYAERVLQLEKAAEEIDVPLQVFRIGPVGITAIPFEVFTETGLLLKDESPLEKTFTIELANGSFGYLPTPEQHELGGYETWIGTNFVEKTASDKIEQTLLELLSEVTPE